MDLEFVEEPRGEGALVMPAPWTRTFLSPAACLASRMAAVRWLTWCTAGHWAAQAGGGLRLRM